MSRIEYISPEGLRLDGRRSAEFRKMDSKLNVLPAVDGSAIFELGNTRVLATISGPHESRQKSQTLHDRAHISVQFHAATFSSASGDRRKTLRQDRKMGEWERLVQEVFEAAIITSQYPKSVIEISVEVLNADGGVLAAAINATTLALITAGIPLYDYVVACSVLHLANVPMLDANRMEESGSLRSQAPSMTIAAYGRNPNLTLLINEDGRMSLDKMQSMIDLAKIGLSTIFKQLDQNIVQPHIERISQLQGVDLV